MGMTYNPMAVMMGNPGKTGTPYIGGQPPKSPGGPIGPLGGEQTQRNILPMGGGAGTKAPPWNKGGGFGTTPASGPTTQPNIVAPESVRATGSGPFDNAYRQDLATFAGGLFNRPGGNLSFNPTSNQGFGQAVGGGNAPLLGMPATLLQNALGGNPFSYTPPTPKTEDIGNPTLSMNRWLEQFMNQGNSQRGGRMALE